MIGTQPALQKKICMLGGFSVGKTSLVKRFVESVFSEAYLTTVGVKIDKKAVDLGDRAVNLILWDVAGEDGHLHHQDDVPAWLRRIRAGC
jgi:GTPase SAR1 family protein